MDLSNEMIEALDTEIGRLLVGIGVATRGNDGKLAYRPDKSDTMIVLVGDNGSCFRQLDLAQFDALIWPTPRSIDRNSVTFYGAGGNGLNGVEVRNIVG